MSLTGEAKKRADAARYERIKADPELLEQRRAKAREAVRRYRARLAAEDPEKAKAIRRKQNLKHNYGITPDGVVAMLEAQGHRCKICNIELLKENGVRNCKRGHVVDHCHTTKRIRGILCHRCNQGLGLFRDNPDYLATAIKYLQE
jgi:hypothetical protein